MANEIKTTDLNPAISIDVASNFTKNIKELQKLLGICELRSCVNGSTIKTYKTTVGELTKQGGEGEVIGLTKVTRAVADTIEIVLEAYRAQVTAQAIQKVGADIAINEKDSEIVRKIQSKIKGDFIAGLKKGTGESKKGTTLQATLATAWGNVNKYFVDYDATPIYFVSTEDVADYLGTAQVSTQTLFGMTYIENFLGLGDVVITPSLNKGEVIATAKENLRGAFVPATSGDVATAFSLMGDETGLIGITHNTNTDNATIDTLFLSGIVFYAEMKDGVFVVKNSEEVGV